MQHMGLWARQPTSRTDATRNAQLLLLFIKAFIFVISKPHHRRQHHRLLHLRFRVITIVTTIRNRWEQPTG